MGTKPEQTDTITIETDDEVEIYANRVDIYVTIKGKSLFTGQEAFKKAREVSDLVENLTNYGLQEKDILLQGIQTEVSTGVIGKQSSAEYRLRIKCRKLDELADVLGIITTQQNTKLGQLIWRYDDAEEQQSKLLEKCISRSKKKAEKVASSLGIKLLGVHEFNERTGDTELSVLSQPVAARGAVAFSSKAVTKETLGLSVSHSKRVNLRLTIKYRVSPFESMKEER
jgi:uncharacterized protein YggE